MIRKSRLGSLCPKCNDYPVYGYLPDHFQNTDEINIVCKSCKSKLNVKVRYIPQTTITLLDEAEFDTSAE
jgi:hypothetical protein